MYEENEIFAVHTIVVIESSPASIYVNVHLLT